MKGALAAITEASSSYGGAYMGSSYSMDISSGKQGFSKRIDDLVKISEKAKRLIAEKDTDGVVSFNYHDDRTTATNLQVNLVKLERYSSNVSRYLKEKIDQPFYEEMDKVGARLEALSIRSYTTSNTVGFKRTEYVPDATGMQFVSREVTPPTISLSDLYKVDSPYKATLEKSYEQFRNSDAYKDNKLSKDDYLMAMHHTRAFTYDSIDDQKERIEMWRDLALTAGVIILTIFCPPAGAAAGVVLAGADMYSAAVGKDWGTGRELDNTERVLRGVFSLFDLIPGVSYLNDLAKTGKKAGLAAVKASLKEGISEGLEQGAKNLDNFKGLLTKAKGFGDDVLKNVDNYAKQLDNFAKSKLSSVADNVAGKLRQADEVVSDVARRFSLNDGLEFQLVSGAMPSSGPGKLSGLADNLSAFAKNLDSSLDEVLEGGGKLGDNILPLDLSDTDILKTKPKNSPTPQKWLDKGGKIEIDHSKIPPEWLYTDWEGSKVVYVDGFPDFKGAGYVRQEVLLEEGFETRSRDFAKADKLAETPKSLDTTWHHHQDGKTLQEIETRIHARFTHRGGFALRKK
ncbi:HNH endonuclease [Streptococcus suis]